MAQADAPKLKFKSRFGGLVKTNPGMSFEPDGQNAHLVMIEGEEYLEFDKLPGVYFSRKLFA